MWETKIFFIGKPGARTQYQGCSCGLTQILDKHPCYPAALLPLQLRNRIKVVKNNLTVTSVDTSQMTQYCDCFVNSTFQGQEERSCII